jgi:hypothetical protein
MKTKKREQIETIKRPNLELPLHVWKALQAHSDKLGLKPSGGAVQAIESWIESTQDQIIFPG